jgi:ribosomal-protein-alanine N-acetyltransferase
MNKSIPNLETDSISLFVLRPEHVNERYVSWLNEKDVNQYLESRFQVHDIESVKRFVADCNSRSDTLLFGIRYKALGDIHVGNIKIGPVDYHHRRAEIGILIGDRNVWGRGVATEAIKLVASFAFSHMLIKKLTAGCYGANLGSKRAFQKAGFYVEGIRERHFVLNEGVDSLILLAMWSK